MTRIAPAALFLSILIHLTACGGGPPVSRFQFPDEYVEATEDLAEADEVAPEDVLSGDGACLPSCDGKGCGDDGCGGSCGECDEGFICLSKGDNALCVEQGGCPPGERLCSESRVLECDEAGVEYVVVRDCDALDLHCVGGECTGCLPACGGKACGDDGCGGSCGSCGPSMACSEDQCLMSCEHPLCSLSEWCIDAEGHLALCGGVIDFEHDLSGQGLGVEISVEEMYGAAGILISTNDPNSTAETNPYKVNSPSKGNSCASHDKWGQYWLDDLIIRFVVPLGGSFVQGATHNVSLYIAETWPGGIRVDFFTPGDPPGVPGAAPFHQIWTGEGGTAFIQHFSPTPIGYLMVRKESDENFTIDDLGFGPIRAD
ncbi:MAG: hypothetical protein ABIK09_12125 [Pseudomonadota bacterium]